MSSGQNYDIQIHSNPIVNSDCSTAGLSYNPYGKNHGNPTDVDRHVGDLGTYEFGVYQETITFSDHLVDLTGHNNVLDRSFVIHEGNVDSSSTVFCGTIFGGLTSAFEVQMTERVNKIEDTYIYTV
jgi:Cu/Zn superoxide dismutase